jgi:hypothetical protein
MGIVKCSRCERPHEKNSTTYIKLCGAVHIGDRGGILGKDGNGITYYCLLCFVGIVNSDIKMVASKL